MNVLAGRVVANRSSEDAVTKLVLILPDHGPRIDEIIERFAKAGIECQGGYKPLHLQGIGSEQPLARTEDLWERVLCVPVDYSASPSRVHSILVGYPGGMALG